MTALPGRLVLFGCLVASPAALAQAYTERNVTIVVTSAAGALTDVLTRAVAQRLSETWKQSVIVENRGGAGYAIAAGYGTIPAALLVNPALPVNSVGDLIALAKKKPGDVKFGTAGVGTALHIAAVELENLTGTQVTAVHYRGAAPALTDVIAGHIDAVIMGPSVALSSVSAGKLKMLAFGSDKRVPQFPDVPTIAETVPGYEASVSFGLFATAGTPAGIVRKINADVQKIVGDGDFQKKYLDHFAVQPIPGPLDAYADYLRKDSAKWGKVIDAAHVTID